MTTTNFTDAGRNAHANGVMRAPTLDPAVLQAINGRQVGDPETIRVFADWLAGWGQAHDEATELELTLEDLVELAKDASDAVIAGRPLTSFVPIDRNKQHTHSTDAIIGYTVRVTVHAGHILADGGYTVETFDGGNLYPAARKLAMEYRDNRGVWAAIDRLYACGCRSNI